MTKNISEEVRQELRLKDLEDKSKGVSKKYKALQNENIQLQRLLEAVDYLQEAPATVKITRQHSKHTGEATAVALASDWHIEEVVEPRTVGGSNRYTPKIAEARSKEFFQVIVKHVERESSAIKIDNLILALMGDFITSNIHEECMENCAMRPIDATMFAFDLLASGIDFLLNATKLKITLPCNVGNHSRITKKQRSATEQGNSLEALLYSFLKKRYERQKRVTFVSSGGYHVYIPVYRELLRFHHGHAIRYAGGIGGLTIPAHKAIMRWNKQRNATLDCFGHLHQRWQTTRFISNGSQIGYNAYALSKGYEFDVPVQQFFLVDKLRGVTVRAPILYKR